MIESDLVTGFVERVLNGCDAGAIDDLCDARFRDFDPIAIPGYPNRKIQDREYIRALCGFLRSDDVDVYFTLEDMFGIPGKIAYQLFGEGLVTVDSPTEPPVESGRHSTSPSVVPTFNPFSVMQASTLAKGGRLLKNKLHVQYRSIGIFRIGNRRLVERRGQIVVS